MFNRISPPLDLNASKKIPDIAKDIESKLDPKIEEKFPIDSSSVNIAKEFEDFEKEIVEPIDVHIEIDDTDDSDQSGSAIEKVLEDGFEAIAFYKSFRFINQNPAPGYWGIFYIKPRVRALHKEIRLDLGRPSDQCLEELLKLLYGHEIYHYKVDATCLEHEAFSNKLIYRQYRNYVGRLPMSDWWEEAVANHYGLQQIDSNFQKYFEDFVRNSPGAYSNGVYKDDGSPFIPRARLAEQITQSLAGQYWHLGGDLINDVLFNTLKLSGFRSNKRTLKYDGDPQLSNTLALKNCPQYWISWYRAGKVINGLKPVSLREVTNEYIPKYLAGEIVKKTDHEFFRIDNGEQIKCPNPHNKDVMPHELKNIVRKAGMSIQDFWVERAKTNTWRRNIPRPIPVKPMTSSD